MASHDKRISDLEQQTRPVKPYQVVYQDEDDNGLTVYWRELAPGSVRMTEAEYNAFCEENDVITVHYVPQEQLKQDDR